MAFITAELQYPSMYFGLQIALFTVSTCRYFSFYPGFSFILPLLKEELWVSRLIRSIPLFTLIFYGPFLQGSVEVVLSSYTNGNVTWGEVLQLWDPRAQFWFLYTLFLLFLVSIVVFSAVQYRWLMFIFGFTCLLHLFRGYLPDFKIVLFVTNNLVYFVFGVVFTRFNIVSYLSSYSAFLIFLVLFITAQYGFHNYLGLKYTYRGFEALVLAITSILFVVSASALLSRTSSKALAFIGASSMAIYLMHILAGSGVRVVLSKFFGINDVAVHLLLGCLAGLFLPLLAVYLINRLNIPYLFSAPVSQIFQLQRGDARA